MAITSYLTLHKRKIAAYVFLGLFVVLVIGGIFGAYRLYKNKMRERILNSPEEVIKEILKFIETQRTADGFYYQIAHYENQGAGPNILPTTNAWTALAYSSAYRVFQEEGYLSQAREDTQKFLNFCEVQPGQCFEEQVPLLNLYQNTLDEELLHFLKEQGELLSARSEDAPATLETLETETMGLALLYDITRDNRFLSRAERDLERSKTNLDSIRSRMARESEGLTMPLGVGWNRCEYPLAALALYKGSGQEEYLREAEQFTEDINLGENYNRFETVSTLLPCIETLQELYRLTNQEEYQKLASETLRYVLENNWDSTGGSGANLLADSAYVVYLLSREILPGEEGVLPKEEPGVAEVGQPEKETETPFLSEGVLSPEGELVLPSGDIIKEILKFIDAQKNPEGFYDYVAHYEDQCKEGEGVCPFGGASVFPVDNSWVVLARSAAYQAFQEGSYLEGAREDVDELLTFCRKDPRECLWVLVQLIKFYEIAPDKDLLEFLKTSGDLLLETVEDNPMLIDIEARELALLYDLVKDARFLDEAKNRLELAKTGLEGSEILYEVGGTKVPSSACWYALSTLALHQVTAEGSGGRYLREVEDYIKKIDLEANYFRFSSMTALQPCVETLQELYQITGEENYARLATEMLTDILESNWDSKYSRKFYGEGMILALKDSSMNVLTDSAYMVYLLSRDLSLNFRLSVRVQR